MLGRRHVLLTWPWTLTRCHRPWVGCSQGAALLFKVIDASSIFSGSSNPSLVYVRRSLNGQVSRVRESSGPYRPSPGRARGSGIVFALALDPEFGVLVT